MMTNHTIITDRRTAHRPVPWRCHQEKVLVMITAVIGTTSSPDAGRRP